MNSLRNLNIVRLPSMLTPTKFSQGIAYYCCNKRGDNLNTFSSLHAVSRGLQNSISSSIKTNVV